MNLVILTSVLVFAGNNHFIAGQLFEGDPCKVRQTNADGICKVLAKCPIAIAGLSKRVYPTACGFRGNEAIVCCQEETPPKLKSRQPGEMAEKMCKNYSQYVWKRELNPTLLVDAEDIVTRDCSFNRQELVVGGTRAERKEFPHMVQLGYEGPPKQWACGGSLISDQFVLTAAHCLDDRSLGLALFARMGIVDIDDPEYLQEFDITERIAHPNYEEPAHYHDIGLVKLNKKATLNTFVRPACLYTKNTSPWSKVIATGWGKTAFAGVESNVLLRVVLELYNSQFCNKIYKRESTTSRLPEGIKDDLMICAGHSTELKDTCQGDSGGPLQVYNTGGENMTCMYDIIGVTSFGKGCALAVDIPGVYTRVTKYLKWIEDHVWPL